MQKNIKESLFIKEKKILKNKHKVTKIIRRKWHMRRRCKINVREMKGKHAEFCAKTR